MSEEKRKVYIQIEEEKLREELTQSLPEDYLVVSDEEKDQAEILFYSNEEIEKESQDEKSEETSEGDKENSKNGDSDQTGDDLDQSGESSQKRILVYKSEEFKFRDESCFAFDGHLHLDALKEKTGEETLHNFSMDKGSVFLGQIFSSSQDQIYSTYLNDQRHIGKISDQILTQMQFKGGYALRTRFYLDHIFYFLTFLSEEKKISFPLQVQYGAFDNFFYIQISCSSSELNLNEFQEDLFSNKWGDALFTSLFSYPQHLSIGRIEEFEKLTILSGHSLDGVSESQKNLSFFHHDISKPLNREKKPLNEPDEMRGIDLAPLFVQEKETDHDHESENTSSHGHEHLAQFVIKKHVSEGGDENNSHITMEQLETHLQGYSDQDLINDLFEGEKEKILSIVNTLLQAPSEDQGDEEGQKEHPSDENELLPDMSVPNELLEKASEQVSDFLKMKRLGLLEQSKDDQEMKKHPNFYGGFLYTDFEVELIKKSMIDISNKVYEEKGESFFEQEITEDGIKDVAKRLVIHLVKEYKYERKDMIPKFLQITTKKLEDSLEDMATGSVEGEFLTQMFSESIDRCLNEKVEEEHSKELDLEHIQKLDLIHSHPERKRFFTNLIKDSYERLENPDDAKNDALSRIIGRGQEFFNDENEDQQKNLLSELNLELKKRNEERVPDSSDSNLIGAKDQSSEVKQKEMMIQNLQEKMVEFEGQKNEILERGKQAAQLEFQREKVTMEKEVQQAKKELKAKEIEYDRIKEKLVFDLERRDKENEKLLEKLRELQQKINEGEITQDQVEKTEAKSSDQDEKVTEAVQELDWVKKEYESYKKKSEHEIQALKAQLNSPEPNEGASAKDSGQFKEKIKAYEDKLSQSQRKIKELDHKLKFTQKLVEQAEKKSKKKNSGLDSRLKQKLSALELNISRLEKEKKATESAVTDAKKEGQKYKQESIALKNLLEVRERELAKYKTKAS